jgi:hypothetical protein
MQVIKELPSYERLHEIFFYEDGKLFWREKNLDSIGRRNGMKNKKRAGSLHPFGYRKITIDGHTYMEHRLIWMMFHKDDKIDMIDHINNNRCDNRIENLRLACRSENMQNCILRKDNTSGVKGVNWNARDKKWTVSISTNGKRKSFGNYDDLELADLVVQMARSKNHGKFSNHGLKGV